MSSGYIVFHTHIVSYEENLQALEDLFFNFLQTKKIQIKISQFLQYAILRNF